MSFFYKCLSITGAVSFLPWVYFDHSLNLKSGFRACGIFPFDPQVVLKKIPESFKQVEPEVETVLTSFLKESRFGTSEYVLKRRKTKLSVEPGKSIGEEDGTEEEEEEAVSRGVLGTWLADVVSHLGLSNEHESSLSEEEDKRPSVGDMDNVQVGDRKQGVVNRGDSFRRRRSRSNSLAPPGCLSPSVQQESMLPTVPSTPQEITSYRVAMVGAMGVGKTALISQFMTSECINAYDRSNYDSKQQSVSIMLNGEESELNFENVTNPKQEIDPYDPQDAFVIMYSVIDKASFQRAENELARLLDMELLRSRPAIIVANKIDLARSRTVSAQDGKCLACTFRAKYIEVSVGINHNIDELLVGILNQIRLKRTHAQLTEGDPNQPHWYKSRGVVRASMKARQMITWLFGKEDSKFKNCENLHIL